MESEQTRQKIKISVDSLVRIRRMHPVPERKLSKNLRRVGRVAMQRIANPWTSVRLRDAPPSDTSSVGRAQPCQG